MLAHAVRLAVKCIVTECARPRLFFCQHSLMSLTEDGFSVISKNDFWLTRLIWIPWLSLDYARQNNPLRGLFGLRVRWIFSPGFLSAPLFCLLLLKGGGCGGSQRVYIHEGPQALRTFEGPLPQAHPTYRYSLPVLPRICKSSVIHALPCTYFSFYFSLLLRSSG